MVHCSLRAVAIEHGFSGRVFAEIPCSLTTEDDGEGLLQRGRHSSEDDGGTSDGARR